MQENCKYVERNHMYSSKNKKKQIEIADLHFVGIIDTGSDLSLINQNCYNKIDCPKFNSNTINFDSLDALNNSMCDSFIIGIIIDGEVYEITFHIVDNKIMKHAVLIGADYLSQVELYSVQNHVTI